MKAGQGHKNLSTSHEKNISKDIFWMRSDYLNPLSEEWIRKVP